MAFFPPRLCHLNLGLALKCIHIIHMYRRNSIDTWYYNTYDIYATVSHTPPAVDLRWPWVGVIDG